VKKQIIEKTRRKKKKKSQTILGWARVVLEYGPILKRKKESERHS
jgi:hypothetical protein